MGAGASWPLEMVGVKDQCDARHQASGRNRKCLDPADAQQSDAQLFDSLLESKLVGGTNPYGFRGTIGGAVASSAPPPATSRVSASASASSIVAAQRQTRADCQRRKVSSRPNLSAPPWRLPPTEADPPSNSRSSYASGGAPAEEPAQSPPRQNSFILRHRGNNPDEGSLPSLAPPAPLPTTPVSSLRAPLGVQPLPPTPPQVQVPVVPPSFSVLGQTGSGLLPPGGGWQAAMCSPRGALASTAMLADVGKFAPSEQAEPAAVAMAPQQLPGCMYAPNAQQPWQPPRSLAAWAAAGGRSRSMPPASPIKPKGVVPVEVDVVGTCDSLDIKVQAAEYNQLSRQMTEVAGRCKKAVRPIAWSTATGHTRATELERAECVQSLRLAEGGFDKMERGWKVLQEELVHTRSMLDGGRVLAGPERTHLPRAGAVGADAMLDGYEPPDAAPDRRKSPSRSATFYHRGLGEEYEEADRNGPSAFPPSLLSPQMGLQSTGGLEEQLHSCLRPCGSASRAQGHRDGGAVPGASPPSEAAFSNRAPSTGSEATARSGSRGGDVIAAILAAASAQEGVRGSKGVVDGIITASEVALTMAPSWSDLASSASTGDAPSSKGDRILEECVEEAKVPKHLLPGPSTPIRRRTGDVARLGAAAVVAGGSEARASDNSKHRGSPSTPRGPGDRRSTHTSPRRSAASGFTHATDLGSIGLTASPRPSPRPHRNLDASGSPPERQTVEAGGSALSARLAGFGARRSDRSLQTSPARQSSEGSASTPDRSFVFASIRSAGLPAAPIFTEAEDSVVEDHCAALERQMARMSQERAERARRLQQASLGGTSPASLRTSTASALAAAAAQRGG